MKVKYLVIVSLILAVLAIGAVSASEDISDEVGVSEDISDEVGVSEDISGEVISEDSLSDDDLAVNDEMEDELVPDEDSLSSSNLNDEITADGEHNLTYNIRIPEYVRIGECDETETGRNPSGIVCEFEWGEFNWPTGNFYIFVDNQMVFNDTISKYDYMDEMRPCYELNKLDNGFGNHTVEVKYDGDNYYSGFSVTGTYELYYMKALFLDELVVSEPDDQYMFVDLARNLNGNLEVLIDDNHLGGFVIRNGKDYIEYQDEDYDDEFESGGIYVYLGNLDLALGSHSYKIIYSGGNYQDKTLSGNFDVTYLFRVKNDYINYGYPIQYGEEIEVDICLVEAAGNLTLTLNGKDYDIEITGKNMKYIVPDLVLGKNNLTFTYKNDKYFTRQLNYTLEFYPHIDWYCSGYDNVMYNSSNAIFSIVLPSDASGNLSVYGDYINYDLIKTVQLKNGRASISLSDLDLGYHHVKASYVGEDYSVGNQYGSFTITPNITYPKGIWTGSGENQYVLVESPQDATGNLTIGIYEAIEDLGDYEVGGLLNCLYNGSITSRINKTLPNLNVGLYFLVVNHFNDDGLISNSEFIIDVRDANPNLKLEFNIPSELDKNEFMDFIDYAPVSYPNDLNGDLSLWIDGIAVSHGSFFDSYHDDLTYDANHLKVGTHKWEIKYVDDTYYNPTSVNGTLKIYGYDISFDISNPVYLDSYDDEFITGNSPIDAKGNVTISIGGEIYYNKPISEIFVMDKDEYNNELWFSISLDDLDCEFEYGDYDIEVNYTGNDYVAKNLTDTLVVTHNEPSIDISVSPSEITIGGNTIVSIWAYNACGNFEISVDDGEFESINLDDGEASKVLSNLALGRHKIVIRYTDELDEDYSDSFTYYVNVKEKTVQQAPANAPVNPPAQTSTPAKETVKLTLKTATIKKSAKKVVLQVTVKVKGKLVKNKIVKFKFNGKTYKVKTNRKGVAKLVLKKKALKKLKVGKKVAYSVSYSGKTVKKSVKVKK